MTPSAATPSPTPYEQEIRFAVVMYGGISLAIYMHGAAQELLRLVRATSGADLNGDEVARIYKALSLKVRAISSTAGDVTRRPTRFTIDVLSGTSAGGINAVFLAKALATRSKGLDQLRKTWIEDADLDRLLQKTGIFDRQRSLLDGKWMYEILYKAFREINDAPKDENQDYQQVEQLDLFVTTTDLNGVETPIGLANQEVPERVHKGSFHFQFESLEVEGTKTKNDFSPDYDAMLAFASRCTSSFPVAFAPMKLTDVEAAVGEEGYKPLPERYERFFSWVRRNNLGASGRTEIPFDKRELADGGYLDNKPFGHVVKAMSYRPTHLEHSRKLLYIDPFPESRSGRKELPQFDFARNALAAGVELPRYETIRDDIGHIKDANRRQERLRALERVFDRAVDKVYGEGRALFAELPLSEQVKKYGPNYATYHGIRVFGVSDDVSRTIASLGGSGTNEGLYLAIRFLVRHWRILTYSPEGTEAHAPENEFLTDFDFAFRLRRLATLIEWAQKKRHPQLVEALLVQLVRINRMRDLLCRAEPSNPLAAAIDEFGKVVQWSELQSILKPATEEERRAQAGVLYRLIEERSGTSKPIETLVDAMRSQWVPVFDRNRTELRALREQYSGLDDKYKAFDLHDMMSLTFLEGSDVREHTLTEIFRISPAEGIHRDPEAKLAGYKLLAFGAFLERSWRENDILWGRLDTSEQLVNAILPHEGDAELRKEFIGRLRSAILHQEAALRRASDISLTPLLLADAQGTLEQALESSYELPVDPLPGKSSRQAALAADIFGRMVEDDLGRKGQPASGLQLVGGVVAGLAGFLTPGTLARVFWNYWLTLLLVIFLVIYVAGRWILDQPLLVQLGGYGLGAGFLLCILSFLVGEIFVGRVWPMRLLRPIKWIVLIAAVVLIAIGWRQFIRSWSLEIRPLLEAYGAQVRGLWEVQGWRYLGYAAAALVVGTFAFIGVKQTWQRVKARLGS